MIHIIICKTSKTLLKVAREKLKVMYKGTPLGLSDLSTEFPGQERKG